jgi:hypothetical protein
VDGAAEMTLRSSVAVLARMVVNWQGLYLGRDRRQVNNSKHRSATRWRHPDLVLGSADKLVDPGGGLDVVQIRRETVPRRGRLRLCGLGPSNRMTALSASSTDVTTRRMSSLKSMSFPLAFLFGPRPGASGACEPGARYRVCLYAAAL